ncbi:MAG: amino acid adenylation domain-containing protein, partial [Chloroflexota bacterium]
WFLDQLEPSNPIYNIPAAIQSDQTVNVEALEKSLNHILQRHETLRTVFITTDGEASQRVSEFPDFTLPIIDLQTSSGQEQTDKIQQTLSEEARRPFKLDQGPFLRAALLLINPNQFILSLTMHHIASDGWSMAILFRELDYLYQTYLQGETPQLPGLPIQYSDFAIWQRSWLQDETLETQLDYWRTQLADSPPLLNLPTDHPRPPIQTFEGSRKFVSLSPSLTQEIKALCQQENVTLFMTLLAAFQSLLYRYTGQPDIIVGTTIASRNWQEIENLIGFFVNSLVLRTDLSGAPTFRELLNRTRETALGAYNHQDIPFEKLVAELQPERNLSHSSLFQVMFILQNTLDQPSTSDQLTHHRLSLDTGTTKFDLTLFAAETEQGLRAWIEYNIDLFEAQTIERMLGHWQQMLEAMVHNLNQSITQIALPTPAESQKILLDWNETTVEYPSLKAVHHLFEDQVIQNPEGIAVTLDQNNTTETATSLTYQELNQRANQLARHLQSLGVGSETLVGVYLERSLEMVISLMAILKAGGAYIPLDPDYPQGRITFMAEDAALSVLLTQSYLLDRLPAVTAQVICLDQVWDQITTHTESNLTSHTSLNTVAYVLYTSGSTGQPKGAMIEHQAVANHMTWMAKAFDFDRNDKFLQKTSFSFDASGLEFFVPLVSGGQLVLIPPEAHRDATYMAQAIQTYGVTSLQCVPTQLHMLLLTPEFKACETLKRVYCGGEPLSQELCQQFAEAGLTTSLINLYGPTEACIDTTFWQMEPHETIPTNGAPIGRPIDNVQVYLLDRFLNPVPVGIPGELHVGGAGLGRGYLNRPGLTSQKFITNPFGSGRLYKTGDLARYRPDGVIEFMGRIDHQVKLRGFRLELGEIEAKLVQQEAVKTAVVIIKHEEGRQDRLVAYLITKDPTSPNLTSLLRTYLQEHLPDYMVPNAFIVLDKLPLTANGKVDRKALPDPEQGRPASTETLIDAQTSEEKVLANIWAEVLRIEQVGITDNFFELGGDSILMIQIIARANQAGLRITPRQFFQYQTVETLATVAEAAPTQQIEQGVVTGSVQLTPIQHWFFEQNLPNRNHWNQAMRLETSSPLDPILLEEAAQALIEHHDVLRVRFQLDQATWHQNQESIGEKVTVELIDLSNLSDEAQEAALQATATTHQATLSIHTGPLIKLMLIDVGSHQSDQLIMTAHHLVVDGISWRILIEDLETAYKQLKSGQQIKLPAKTTSFQNWAKQLDQYAQSETIQKEADYWLSSMPTNLASLPTDHAAAPDANTEGSAQTITVSLNTVETQALLQEVPPIYQTQINDVLLTALVQTIIPWIDQSSPANQLTWRNSSLLINLEGHGREDIIPGVDLSRTVGWFTTIFPVNLTLPKTPDLGDALKSIKEQLRAIPNRGIGYGILRYLTQDTALRQPLVDVQQAEISFNYLGQFDPPKNSDVRFYGSSKSAGAVRDPQNQRAQLLGIDGFVRDEQLHVAWRYSQNFYKDTTIKHLAQTFMDNLRAIIEHCQNPNVGGYTPSDFSDANLSQDDLDDLLAELD